MKLLASTLLVLVACSDDGGTTGPRDAPLVPVDIDNGSCGDQLRFTGELVDWDSSEASFCGVFEALFQVQGDGNMDTTAPNGRFDLCIPRSQAVTRIDVTPSTTASQCTQPSSTYTLPVLAVANRDVILAGAMFSARAFTTDRQASFFTAVGAAFDPTKAQVLVHVAGTPRAVSLEAAHAAAQAHATTWAPGDTGLDVAFPNVDVGTGTTNLAVAGGAVGTGAIPLVAGTLTVVTVYAN
ncbi:MAG: hypothetical protein H0T79_00035 [Deltaproteobacteria bacterium]|nr:hypothetical protein [Deltaproteobacteria bacterium]